MERNKTGRDQNSLRCPKCNSDYINHNALHSFTPLSEQFLYTCHDCQEQFGFPPTSWPSSKDFDPRKDLRVILEEMKVGNEPRKPAPERVEDEVHPVYDCDPAYLLTEDLLHDYKMMLKDFGPDDKEVIIYKEELEKRGMKL